ncbi:MAG: hypothetical protein DWQ45_13340 [Planctomycetota bacterium]|nr:MAG: hypothetical protein DWQ45_13340 [Planctomycetota bacterium]
MKQKTTYTTVVLNLSLWLVGTALGCSLTTLFVLGPIRYFLVPDFSIVSLAVLAWICAFPFFVIGLKRDSGMPPPVIAFIGFAAGGATTTMLSAGGGFLADWLSQYVLWVRAIHGIVALPIAFAALIVSTACLFIWRGRLGTRGAIGCMTVMIAVAVSATWLSVECYDGMQAAEVAAQQQKELEALGFLVSGRPLRQWDVASPHGAAAVPKLAAAAGILNTAASVALYLNSPSVTDGDVRALRDCRTVEKLELHGSQLTDVGLNDIAKMPKLRWLRISNTEVTDAGVTDLVNQRTLEFLDIRGTRVTKRRIDKLREIDGLRVVANQE